MKSQLHEQDFNLWVEQTVQQLKDRDLENMDWDNLIDEIEDMGRSEKRSLDSYLQRLIEHILKLNHWDTERERCSHVWKKEVTNFRNRIKRILKKNPSLKSYMASEYPEIYSDAVKYMSYDFNIPEDSFVELETIMQEDYFGSKY